MLAERNFQIGIVQMSCTPEPEQNLERAIVHIQDAAARGAEVVCLPELFQTQYFCQREDIALFDLAEPIPGPTTARLGDLAREMKITIVASLFERRAPASITILRPFSVRMASWPAFTARCTFPTIPSITKSITSHPAIWVSRPLKLASEKSGRWSVGTSGIPKQRV